MNNIQNHPINFTAKLDIKNINYNKKRWNNIAKIFEENTSKISDEFVLSEHDSFSKDFPPELRINAYTSLEQRKMYNKHYAEMQREHMLNFYKNSDEIIAKKLEKLLNIFRREDSDKKLANDFFEKISKNDRHNDASNFNEKFWNAVTEKLETDTRTSIIKDPILKKFKIR